MKWDRMPARTQSGKSYDETRDEMTFIMVLPGDPIPLARHRVSEGRVYMKSEQREAMQMMQWDMVRSMKAQGFKLISDKALRVHLQFNFKAEKKKHGPKITRSDLDNLIKFILDAGNKMIWEDDGLIYAISAAKHWGEKSETIMQVTWKHELSEKYVEERR